MGKIKVFICLLSFGIVFFIWGKIFSYMVVDDTVWYSTSRIMMHELYTQESNIDVLFVGSSHCYRSFVPEIADKLWQKNTFNAGTSSQDLDGSLAVIKEAAKKNKIEHVYLEIYYGIAMHPAYKKRTEMTSTYLLSDYMKPSLNKLDYLLHASSKEYYVNSFIPARRYWESFSDLNYMKNIIQRKNTKIYREYKYDFVTTEKEYYAEKGYVASNEKVEKGTYWTGQDFAPIKEENISTDWRKSLQKIIKFCQEHDIELTLISSPMPDFRLYRLGNYDDYIQVVNDIIQGTGVKYYDFNLCRENYFSGEELLFMDTDHLSKTGAEKFTTLFSEFCMGDIPKEELFYDSYEEKVKNMPFKIFGFVVTESKEEHLITIEPVTNAEIRRVAYFISKISDDQKVYKRKGSSPECNIFYTEGEKGILKVTGFLDGRKMNEVTAQYGQE
ncbi:MAG: hypothetical protein HFH41_04295 [Lachnospiraceae bacterium]|nr:hypothetical protein [Lachnospiraceae bacterium]